VSEQEVDWSVDPFSLCQQAIKGLNPPDHDNVRRWWKKTAPLIQQAICRRRNDVTNLMKVEFIGKKRCERV